MSQEIADSESESLTEPSKTSNFNEVKDKIETLRAIILTLDNIDRLMSLMAVTSVMSSFPAFSGQSSSLSSSCRSSSTSPSSWSLRENRLSGQPQTGELPRAWTGCPFILNIMFLENLIIFTEEVAFFRYSLVILKIIFLENLIIFFQINSNFGEF